MSMAQKFLSCEINSCSCSKLYVENGKVPGYPVCVANQLVFTHCMFLYLDCILCEIFFLKCMQIHGVVLCGFSQILFGCSRDSTRARAGCSQLLLSSSHIFLGCSRDETRSKAGCSQLLVILNSAAAVTKQGLEPAAVSF